MKRTYVDRELENRKHFDDWYNNLVKPSDEKELALRAFLEGVNYFRNLVKEMFK